MTSHRFILASQSPRRRELLAMLGLPFEVISPSIKEQKEPHESPEGYARRLSSEKAQTVAGMIADSVLILAADTVVIDSMDVLEKPVDAADAVSMLNRLRGRTHTVITAVTLLNTASGEMISEAPASPVTMRNYTDQEIAAYVATGDPMDKAGAYAIQHPTFQPAENFDHCFANVMGLPICRAASMLEAIGITLPASASDARKFHMGYPCPIYTASTSKSPAA